MADAAAAKEAFDNIVAILDYKRIVAYINVASATLFIYDVIINLPVEIEYIWIRKWSFLTILYVMQRYLPLLDSVGLVLHHHFGTNLSTRYCALNYKVVAGSFVVGIILSEILLTVRVWAVWERKIPVASGLALFFLACLVPSFVLLTQFFDAVDFATFPFPNSSSRGCFILLGSRISFVHWVLWMVYETGTLVMMLIPGVTAWMMGRSSELVQTVYRDGVIYYLFMSLCSIINVMVIRSFPRDFVILLSSFECVLHSLLTSRAILHIRQVAWQRSATSQTSVSQIRFASNELEEHSSFGPGESTRLTKVSIEL